MIKQEKYSRLILSRTDGIGTQKFKKILKHFDSAQAYLKYVSKDSSNKFIRPDIKLINECYEKDINDFLVIGEENYPKLLSNIDDYPITLFFRGDQILDSRRCISIVGTRYCNKLGEDLAYKLAYELGAIGYTIVSGMAKGIDTMAHRGALDVNAKTVAVLGTGINQIYPVKNSDLYKKIVESGLVLSEFESVPISAKHVFPRRNRIIAGLSPVTIVIQAPEKSGALITAELAFDYNREVYAVPGDITDFRHSGCNKLISRNIAKIVVSASSLVEEINSSITKHLKPELDRSELGSEQLEIIELITQGDIKFDQLIESVNIIPSQLNSILTKLELNGIVAKNSNGFYTVQT